MLILFYVLAGLLVLQSLYALGDGFRFLDYVRRSKKHEPPPYAPPVSVLCPYKGLEEGFEKNIQALFNQDYLDYELIFALAEESDAARAVLERLIRESNRPARILIVGKPAGRGEKVNNLLRALAAVRKESEVLVFVDSDARPPVGWLRALVAPLAEAGVGATTGFRWYLPVRGGFASALESAWNAPIATLLGDHAHNFCWGGSTAIRRETFAAVRAADFWRGAVSDDYALTRALRAARRRILFVPSCLIPTHHDASLGEFLDWSTRQIILTRIYAPHLWHLALASHLLYCGTFLYGFLLAPMNPSRALAILALLAAITLLGMAKGGLRWWAVREALSEAREAVDRYWWVWTLLAPIVPWVLLYNLFASALTRRITWRGLTYELRSPEETIVLN